MPSWKKLQEDLSNSVLHGARGQNHSLNLIFYFRIYQDCHDPFIIYTGYYPEEIDGQIKFLSIFENIIIKFGRYIPNRNNKYDEILGVTLASDNQFAKKIS